MFCMRIGMDPDVFTVAGFVFTWHGLFTLISVVLGIYLATRWARHKGIVPDVVFTMTVWAIIGGIIGARLVHVIDWWSGYYRADLVEILALWNGGLDVFGALLGGLAGAWAYSAAPGLRLTTRDVSFFKVRVRVPLPGIDSSRATFGRLRHLMDVSALLLPLALAVGRIGGIINGAQVGRPTDMPWGITYTHPESLTNRAYELQATHPAVAYEMLWDLCIFGVLWFLRDRVRPDGMFFGLFLVLYSVGRFFIGFLRYHDKVWLAGMGIDQLIALVLMIAIIPVVTYRAHFVRRPATSTAAAGRRSRR